MDLQAIFTSAVTTTVITILWNFFSKGLDYKIDHKKYILKKRQEAYEALSPIVYQLMGHFQNGPDVFSNVFSWSGAFDSSGYRIDKKSYPGDKVSKSFSQIFAYGQWYSAELDPHLRSLDNSIHAFQMELSPEMTEKQFISTAKKYSTSVDDVLQKIQKQFFIDMLELGDIKKFVNAKKKLHYSH